MTFSVNQPRTPQVIQRQFTSGGGSQFTPDNSLNVSPAVFSSPLWQTGGVFQQTYPITVGAISSGSVTTIAQTVNLGVNSSFSKFSLAKTQQATIVVCLVIAAPVTGSTPANLIFGQPVVGLTYSSGSASSVAGLNFTVQGPGTFTNPILSIGLPVFAASTYAGGVIMNLNVQALLMGSTT